MDRPIVPLQFAKTIRQAMDYRSAGMSQIEAVTQACRTLGISTDWAMIIQLALDGSSALAESWAEKMLQDALDRAHSERGVFQ